MMLNAGAAMALLFAQDMGAVIKMARRLHLDFDDPCRYVIAEKSDLTIVSSDSDLDRTEQGSKAPGQIPEG